MNYSKFSHGLNITKKPGLSRPGSAAKRPAIFGEDDDSDEGETRDAVKGAEEISVLGEVKHTSTSGLIKPRANAKSGPHSLPPPSKMKPQATPQFGDLSSSLTSRKYAEEAEKLDPSIYDYDASYDSFKAPQKNSKPDAAKKPQYMSNLRKMAEVRERDRIIAEEKKMQREREAEGEEFADKEKFVTEAYKKQQAENRKLEAEEARREEEETKKNKSGGMTGFYKQLLDRGEQRHAEILKAVEENQKGGSKEASVEEEKVKTDADVAREMNKKGGDIAINDEGQVVDKRQLLRGGLNVGAKKKAEVQLEAKERAAASSGRDGSNAFFAGGKQAMRDRQSRMLEAQYEQALKRTRVEEEQERQKIELESKTRKTGAEISSAKERYLARKRAEAEAKKNGAAEETAT